MPTSVYKSYRPDIENLTGEEEKKKWRRKAGTPFRGFGRTRERSGENSSFSTCPVTRNAQQHWRERVSAWRSRASGVPLLLFQRCIRENSSRAITPRNTNYNFTSFRDRRRFNEDTTSRKQRFNRQKRTCQLTAGKIAFS